MIRALHLLILTLVLLVLPAAPALAQPASGVIRVTDDHGTTVTLSHVPQRLVSLAPNVTEIMFALGLGSRVVGVSSYSNYPKAASKLPVVITYTGLDQEKLLRLKPDLVVAAATVPQATIAKLRSLHLTVIVTDPHDIAGIMSDIRLVAVAAGVPATGQALTAKMQARISAIAAKIRHATTRPRVFYELRFDAVHGGTGQLRGCSDYRGRRHERGGQGEGRVPPAIKRSSTRG